MKKINHLFSFTFKLIDLYVLVVCFVWFYISEDKNDLKDNKIKSNPMNNAVFLSCRQEMFVSR